MVRYDKKIFAIMIAFIGLFILGIIGFTYGYFIAGVEGNQNANETVIETVDLRLVFNDTQIISLDESLPGISVSKIFTVQNIGNSRQRYDIDITDVTNTFVNDELVYSITSDNEDGGEVEETPMPTEDATLLTSSIDAGVTITYTITIKFIETGSNQNSNQEAEFAGKLQIVPRIMGVALAGYVYDENDDPMSNVTVEVHSDPISVITDEIGYYEISDIPVGVHTLYIKDGETVLGSKEVVLLSSETSEIKNNNQIYLPDKVEKYVNIKVENELNIFITEKQQQPTLKEKILADNTSQSDLVIDFAQRSSSTNGQGLYYTANNQYGEDGERIYYFRGAVTNNWVSFAGYLWRVVRTTSEGGVKLVYSGNGSGDSSGYIDLFKAFNAINDSKYHVGYTYNTSSYTTLPQTDSTIKTTIDSWYNSYLSSYGNYLSETAIYCSDRSSESVNGYEINYPGWGRLYYTDKRPTYACPWENGSRYTVSSTTGNGYLTKPIALLTADEVYYTGLIYSNGTTSSNSYIMDNAKAAGRYWWLMSPHTYDDFMFAHNFRVSPSGNLFYEFADSSNSVRPSVSLKSCITVTEGDGQKSTPYVLSNSSCT